MKDRTVFTQPIYGVELEPRVTSGYCNTAELPPVDLQKVELKINKLVMTAKLHQEVIEGLQAEVKMIAQQFDIITQEIQKALGKGEE